MDIILVPGLWLNASTWDTVVPSLEAAGHRAVPLTLPGLESVDTDRTNIGLDDQVAAVVAAIDAAEAPVLLVGHSMGCGVASIAVDRRPESVGRAVYIGGWPCPPDDPLCEGFYTDGPDLPLRDIAEFEGPDLRDFSETDKKEFAAAAIPSPARLATDPVVLSDDRRYDVPITMVCPEYTAAQLQEWIDAGEEPVREVPKYHDVRYVELPTSHWPQVTKPAELATVLVAEAESLAG